MKISTLEVGAYLVTNCYVVTQGTDCAVIDPGFDGKKIIKALDSQGLKPTHILLTHGHFDHTGGVEELRAKYGAKLVMGAPDVPMYKGRVDIQVADGDVVSVGALSFKVLATPGHTRGGVCYICENTIFSGDTLFCDSVGRTDLEGGDFAQLLASLKRIMTLEGDYDVLPGHECPTTLAHERAHNPYYRG